MILYLSRGDVLELQSCGKECSKTEGVMVDYRIGVYEEKAGLSVFFRRERVPFAVV